MKGGTAEQAGCAGRIAVACCCTSALDRKEGCLGIADGGQHHMSMHFDTVAAHQKSRSSVGCMLSGQTSLDAVALAAVAAGTVALAACARALAGLATPAEGDMALIAAAIESLAGARVEDVGDDHPLFVVRD